MTSAAIYARVSSARQKKDQTIGSQTAALREHARQLGVELPEEWVFEDEGHSGATLVRPALEALRDLAAQGCIDVVLCYSPDRLARKFAYQALLIEEFARAGVRVEFVKGPRGDSPEDQLMVQFQGMFAEYERYAEFGIVLVMPTARLCRPDSWCGAFGLLMASAEVGVTRHNRGAMSETSLPDPGDPVRGGDDERSVPGAGDRTAWPVCRGLSCRAC